MAHGPVGASGTPKVKVVARPQKGAGGVAAPRSDKLQPLTVADVAKMTTSEKLARLGFLGATAADRQVADARAASQPQQPQLQAPSPEPASPSQPYAGWRPGQRTKPAYPGEKPAGVIAVPHTAEHPTGLLYVYKHTPTKAMSEGDVAWHQMVDAIGPDVIQKASNPRVALLHDILGNASGITPLVDSISKHKIAATAANLAMVTPWGRVGKAVTGIESGVDAVRGARAADEALKGSVRKALRSGFDRKVFREHAIKPTEIAHLVAEGAPGRMWYEDSARSILQLAHGDKALADRFAQLVAIYSSQRAPVPNMQLAVNAFNEWKATGRVSSFGTAPQIQKANDILVHGKEWSGLKTDRFYANMLEDIHPEKYAQQFPGGEVTNDVWMARLFGLKTDQPTPREYDAMTKAVQRIADHLGWKPKQVQAALWIAKKARVEGTSIDEAGVNFADAIRHETGVVPFEAAPGAVAVPHLYEQYTKLAPEAQVAYTREKAQLVDSFFNETGLMAQLGHEGIGVYEGQINPGWSAFVAASRGKGAANALSVSEHGKQMLDTVATAIGHAFNQDAAAWFKPFYRKGIPLQARNGVKVTLGRTISADEARALDEAFRATGHDIAIIHDADGAHLLNFTFGGLDNRAFHRYVGQELERAKIPVVDARSFAFDGNYIGKDEYANRLGELGRGAGDGSDVLGPAVVRLQERAAAVDARHLGGDAAAGAAQPGLRAQLGDTLRGADQALRDATSGDGLSSGLPLDVRPLLPDRSGPYEPRLLGHNDLTQQMDKSRSRIAQVAQKVIDAASRELQKSKLVTDTPGLRVVSAGERVVKAAGRRQRKDMARRSAPFIDDLKAIDKVDEGSADDVGNFWYAQLPSTHRTGEGLSLVRAKRAEELDYIASGQALEHLSEHEAAVKAQLREAETGSQAGHLLRELEEIKTLKTDLPQRVDDITASMHQLDELIANPPAVNHRAIEAADALMRDRERILVEGGRLKPDRAAPRKSLVSRWLGLEPTGDELYLGHRLPKPESFRGSNMPSGGTGRVRSPQGLGSENKLVLAKTGRLRASLRVAAEDWHSAQIFEQANIARHELSSVGTKFPGHVPGGHALVNPKGRTIPAHWKTDELAQFHENYDDIEELRTQAKEILDGFIATDRASFERMKQDAIDQGVSWDELRIVPKRYVDRYYAQFKPSKGRGAAAKGYDAAVDVVATSIVFLRLGYIPKNFLQATIMAVPHQGAFLPINAVKAAQVARDRELRHFIQAEVGHTGATGALGTEAMSKRITGAAAGFVSKFADDPARFTAFLHEAAAEGVISRTNPMLTEKDRASLLDLFKNEKQRPLLNDISQRAIDAQGDFSRMTPDQSRMARRYLIIPGWLMAGSRYPFKFAFDHPIRTALLAYIAAGEPGAPEGLQFNQPIDEYFTGSSYRRGIETPWGRVRTGSLSPVNTPWDLGLAAVQTARGKQSPYDIAHETAFDFAQPLLAAGVRIAQGDGVKRNLKGLVPNYKLAEGLIHPSASPTYPEDKTRLGRLERELGVVPIKVNDPVGPKTALQKENEWLTRVQRQVGKVPVEVKVALHTKTLYHDAQAALKKDSGVKGLSDRELTKLKLQVLASAHPEYAETAHTFRAELDVSPEALPSINRWAEKALQWDVLDKYSQTADKLKRARKRAEKASHG